METVALRFDDALNRARHNPGRRFLHEGDARIADGLVFPLLKPAFQLERGDSIFAIGSCFARVVEWALKERGLDVLSLGYSVPREEAPGSPNRILNQYNPGTMSEIISSTLRKGKIEGGMAVDDEGMVADLLLSNTAKHVVTMARAEERRRDIVTLYRDSLAKATTVVLTLGLTECWYDLRDQVYLNGYPGPKLAKRDPGRYEFRRLGVEDSLSLLSDMLEQLSEGRNLRLLLSVSPVPFMATFSSDDAVMANCGSKAVLRVVAEELTRRFDFVDYFPSYEIVASHGLDAFEEDRVHVRHDIADKIAGYMLRNYAPQ